MSIVSNTGAKPDATEIAKRPEASRWLYRNWFRLFITLAFIWVGLPWLAPVLMRLGLAAPAKAIYAFYSFQCHQLAQRSFFLFGESPMYSLDQLHTTLPDLSNLISLRQFIGNPEMGYKVAWSDRMVSAYTSIPVAGLLWWHFRKRVRPLPLWGFVLLALPMVIDGGTHFISDLSGLGLGFRYTNDWLATLTGHSFPVTFYAGNALASFNSWMRLITGVLFGAGLAWFAFPVFEDTFSALEKSGERFVSRGEFNP